MAKDGRDITHAAVANRERRRHERGLRLLERRLAAERAVEEKRARQATKARERGAARKLQTKRTRQAEEARRRSAAIAAAIAGLRAAAEVAEVAATAPDDVDVEPAVAPPAVAPRPPATVLQPATPGPAPEAPATTGPRGYCLRERRSVELADPEAIVMRNGRAGIAGTCPGCGNRIARPGTL